MDQNDYCIGDMWEKEVLAKNLGISVEEAAAWKQELKEEPLPYCHDSQIYYYEAMMERRSYDPKNTCGYGIKYLDDKLCGIHNNELVLVAADTGVGKSSITDDMAVHNAEKGKKVLLIRLEGDKNEFAHRLIWKKICGYYYAEQERPLIHNMRYTEYRLNKIRGIEAYESRAVIEMQETLKLINIFNHKGEDTEHDRMVTALTIKAYIEDMLSFRPSRPDIMIVDHLHYFDIMNPRNENHEITTIMKTLKWAAEYYSVPVVAVSHMRKRADRGIRYPGVDELMGTSNLQKVAYTVITVAPVYDEYNHEKHVYPTVIRIAKNRSGIRATTAGKIDYYGRTQSYSDEYIDGKITGDGRAFEDL